MSETPSFCDAYIEVEGDPWAGTYCKLLAGHTGEHSAHYPVAPSPSAGGVAVGPKQDPVVLGSLEEK